MKEFLKIIMRDYASEGFTRKDWLYYGILFPSYSARLCS